MQGLVEFVKTLGAPRIAAMGAVTIALIGFFAFLILRVTAPQMTPLFTDLSLDDSATIVKELDREGVTYELRNDGNIIMVPTDRVARLRMTLAENGLPKGGGVGYEIFDKSDALGTTSFVQNINNLRALEGELARTIRALDRVQDARVHLVMPDRPLFSRDKIDPSASIVLKVRGSLEPHRCAPSATSSLPRSTACSRSASRSSTSRASCWPTAPATKRPAAMSAPTNGRPRSKSICANRSKSIVSSVVGPGHSRVQVNADFDFNRITQTSDKFDPDGRVVRSSQTREETSASNDGSSNQVTVGNELPGANAAPAGRRRQCRRRATKAANRRKSSTTRSRKPPRPR